MNRQDAKGAERCNAGRDPQIAQMTQILREGSATNRRSYLRNLCNLRIAPLAFFYLFLAFSASWWFELGYAIPTILRHVATGADPKRDRVV